MTRDLRLTPKGFAPSERDYTGRLSWSTRHFLRRTVLIVPAAILVWIFSSLPVEAAAPQVLMVYGPPLTRPVFLADGQENETLMLAATDTAAISGELLKGRPYFRLAFFWGSEWAQYVDTGKPLTALRPEQGNQQGRFYPAFGRQGPLLTFSDNPSPSDIRRLDQPGVSVLALHGIPTQYPAPRAPAPTVPFAVIMTAGLITVVVIALGAARFVKPNWRMRVQ